MYKMTFHANSIGIEFSDVNKELSPVAMEQDRRLELIDHAIQKLIHDNRNKVPESHNNHNHNLNDHDAEYQRALSQLLSVSQLEMVKGDEKIEQSEEASSPSELIACVIQKTERGSENDEIMKELKKVKRQNFVTQCLVSAMIVLTVAWQLSEVSLILKVKDGLSHPFRSFGNILKGMVKVPDVNGQEDDNNESPSLNMLHADDNKK
ncbi:hypothetical protein VNO77_44324 [Canavalia gladiata]|uniref:Uncharacterized protein n=1 Tax=Canavalia gladiata TaxID=3824 RepID=A0AAN9JXV1_CANGL